MRINRGRQQAFTLLEVLVAMAISALIYVGAYSLLDSVLMTDEVLAKKRQSLEHSQRALQFMQRDIEQIIPRTVRTDTFEGGQPIEFDYVDSKLSFTRAGWPNPIGRMRSTLQRVSYYLEDGVLYREHWLALDNVAGSEAKKNPLLEGVEALAFRFYQQSTGQWKDSWDPSSDVQQNAAVEMLPAAIEMTIKTDHFGQLVRVFLLVENRELNTTVQ